MATIERTYTIPLRAGFRNAPKYYRTNRAMTTLRNFLAKHMHAKDEDVRVGQHLNELLWKHGIKNPPPRVTVVVTKTDDGIVRAELEGKTYKDSVKPQAKSEEPTSLKEKLQSVVGGKKDSSAEAPAEPAAEEAPKKAEKKAKAPLPKVAKQPSNVEE